MTGTPRLSAGVGRCDITPPVGIVHTNWGAAIHARAERIDMPLRARALAVRDAETGTTAVLIDLDLLLLPRAIADALRGAVADLTGVPAEHVRVSATHTHSGPTIGSTWVSEGTEYVQPYVGALPGKVAGAAWEAVRSLRPARVAHGTGQSDLGVNRRVRGPDGRVLVGRNPDGFVDRVVRVLRVDDADERPLAAVVHYGCHPIIMSWENTAITPDYPGPTRETVERLTGATCLFFQGCAGNIGPNVFGWEGRTGDPGVYRRAGTMLGAEAARVFLGLEPRRREVRFDRVLESGAPLAVYHHDPTEEPDGTVRVAGAEVALPVRPFPTRSEGETAAAAAREELARLRAAHAPDEEVRDATMRAKRAAQQAGHSRLTDGRRGVTVEAQAVRIGGAALLGAPMEVFSEIGAQIAERSPFGWTAVSGYTNGSTGYLPTAEAHDEGGYEVERASPYAREAGAAFAAEAGRLLARLRD
ncbi:MAG TPA: neutral/alkaline non-lysosomal ceramidase N-terminal domain-containing protein [Chloroflexota bacterium]|nr:neutral/alkaline non-lysosomal ceramidase N-terminal domain-containing protein [Chloroflexota bacterium]